MTQPRQIVEDLCDSLRGEEERFDVPGDGVHQVREDIFQRVLPFQPAASLHLVDLQIQIDRRDCLQASEKSHARVWHRRLLWERLSVFAWRDRDVLPYALESGISLQLLDPAWPVGGICQEDVLTVGDINGRHYGFII